MYREDRQVVNIYTLFAGIAIFISSLGLLSSIQVRYSATLPFEIGFENPDC